ncbi:hypothetical protein BS17DRAFT_792836 [Gyrodon lividus]|nr:hypothetical protein BS17DRAFT_792836 [Gyrodon lividus]
MCTAQEHLQLWKPTTHAVINSLDFVPTTTHKSDQSQIKNIITHAWAESTKESYGSGLLVFHVFYDAKSITDSDHTPASSKLIAFFISSLASQLSWLHNMEIKALLKAAAALAPTSSKCKPHELYIVNILIVMHDNLNLADPADAAIFACLTTTFWCTAQDWQGLKVTNFHLPRTKSTFLREDVSWAQQNGHGIHIGSTLKYLLHNIPFNVVKIKGCWASNAFLMYLHHHTQILAPYIQASP